MKTLEKNSAFQFLLNHSKPIVFGLLVLVEIFIIANNWGVVYYAGIPSWYIVLPVSVFLTVENAAKLWALKKFSEKIAFYVMDVAVLLIFTIFTDGSLISLMYIIILSDFYLNQGDLKNNIIMGATCIGVVIVTFAVSNWLKGINLNVITLISSILNDILLITLHFFVLNFAIQIYRKNLEITKALEELNESNNKLQVAYRELQEVTALEERQRIAKDIHDTAGHSITTVIMQTEAARLVVDSDPEEAKRRMAAAGLQARNALEELRESVHLLSGMGEPQSLKQLLEGVIHDSTDGTDVSIRYDIDDVTVCDAKRRFVLNTLKEGLANGLRHGNATAFWFEFKREGNKLRFLLSDNGEGADISTFQEGFGLMGMHARAESLGGDVWFETEPGEGFEIHLVLPCDSTPEEKQ